ncbi:MAG: hypothetical protein M3P49_14605 [Actinomycetota bacterium]|nr:hypothetical protein [Actinomycetota bacterium]
MSEWAKFGGVGSRNRGVAWVSLLKSERFTLSTEAYLLLGEPDRVEILYQKGTKKIGFRATNDPFGSYKVVKPKTGGYQLTAVALVRQLGLDVSRSRRFEARMEGNVLVFDLDDEALSVSPKERVQKREEELAAV